MPNISRSFWSQLSNATASSSRLAPALLTSTRESPNNGSFFRPTDRTTFPPNGEEEVDPKGKRPAKVGDEVEVNDQEWAIRVGSGILHLRATLPHIFDSNPPTNLFPPTIYSNSVSLSLPAPLPLKISTLPLYSLTFSLARHGMHALHTDMDATLHKLAVSPGSSGSGRQSEDHPSSSTSSEISKRLKKPGRSVQRDRQVRVILEVCGMPRLGAQREHTSWQTSSLYTFSPISGLIIHHQVETIRPLPGESVGAWLNERLWGWNVRAGQSEGYQTAPLGAWSGGGTIGMMRGTIGDEMISSRVVVEEVAQPARPRRGNESGTKSR